MPCVFPLLLFFFLFIYLVSYLTSSGLCFFQREEQANFHVKELLKGAAFVLAWYGLEQSKNRRAHLFSSNSDLNSRNSSSWSGFCAHLCRSDLKKNVLTHSVTSPLLPWGYFQGQLDKLFCHRKKLLSLFVLLLQGK